MGPGLSPVGEDGPAVEVAEPPLAAEPRAWGHGGCFTGSSSTRDLTSSSSLILGTSRRVPPGPCLPLPLCLGAALVQVAEKMHLEAEVNFRGRSMGCRLWV